jgi:hypothetical protein
VAGAATNQAIEAVGRIESARLIAGLAWMVGTSAPSENYPSSVKIPQSVQTQRDARKSAHRPTAGFAGMKISKQTIAAF